MADTTHSPSSASSHRRDPRPSGRVLAVDAARALAVVGMVIVNVGPKDGAGAGPWLYLLPHGRASVLFVLLAGIGFSLMTRRTRLEPAPRSRRRLWATLAWRCVLLLLGGLALQLLGHEANVILAVYALLFVVAGLLVRARDGVLVAVAAASLLLGPVLWLGLQVARGAPFTGDPPQLGDGPGEVLASVLVTGPYPLVTWTFPFVVGMWLGRRDLTRLRAQRSWAVVAAVAAVGAPLVGRLSARLRGGVVGDLSWELLLTDAPHGQMPLWLLGATGAAVLLLLACLVAERALAQLGRSALLHPLVVTGQLTLTIYVTHLIALAWLRPLPRNVTEGVALSAAIVAVAVVGALLWRARWRRGPLEVLVRPPWTWRAR